MKALNVVEHVSKEKKVKGSELKKVSKETKISSLCLEVADIQIIGTTDLIVHRRQEIDRTKKLGENTPEKQFSESKYFTSNGEDGICAIAFKKSMERAASFFPKKIINMSKARMIIKLDCNEIVPLEYDECYMRKDIVCIGAVNKKTPDARYRAAYKNWKVNIRVMYPTNLISGDVVTDMIIQAGIMVGVGEWRPEMGGLFGQFSIGDYTIEKI